MKFWHMQLHPTGDSIDRNGVMDVLRKGVVGMGDRWDNDGGQPRRFSDEAQIGDVIMIRNNGPVALVEITSDIRENDDQGLWFKIARSVRLLDVEGEEWRKNYLSEVGKVWTDNLYLPSTFQSADKSEFVAYWHSKLRERIMVNKLVALLKSNKNLILTGAPGTGKTYLARQVAKAITSVLDITANKPDAKSDNIAFIQFHPSYDYSDFVEGLKPDLVNGHISFKVKAGVFKDFCKRARSDETQNYVFIIDEINRADLSRVFGELLFALEDSYRGHPVETQYAYLQMPKEDFFIPNNLYVIGTMNDIDRSVESIDFALRRRFAWKEIDAEYSQIIVDQSPLTSEWKFVAKKRMNALNNEIETIFGSKAFQIGGAYFKKLEHYATSESSFDEGFEKLWTNHIEILLQEYLRGMSDAAMQLQKMKQAYAC